jgi:prepilin-type N-terminal cleavage/methylation domain-containing protein
MFFKIKKENSSSIYPRDKAGFTLIELMVVIVIATVLMTAIVVQQSKWNDQLTVNTQNYELALMIRQAQVYSLGVREDKSGSGDKFNVGYGIYFSQNNTNQYIFFADRNKNQKYDSGEAIETKVFNRGVTIKDVCGKNRCFFTGGGPLQQASVMFFRPDTDAIISLLNNGGNSVDVPPILVTLKSVGNRTSSVKVESNGRVSINNQ